MLYPVAGSRLYIADAPVSAAAWDMSFPASGWVEIGETEALGLLGVEWDVEDAGYIGCEFRQYVKGMGGRPEMQIVLGNDPLDPGQALLWTAARSRDSYPFRLVFPDGTTTRQWFALVIRLGEVFDAANAVMKLQVDLQPDSDIQRSEAAP